MGLGGGYVVHNSEKDIDFCEKGPFKLVSDFDYYFHCFDEK